jgi:hypothetical protein
MLHELHILLRHNGNSVINITHFPYEEFKYVNKYEFGDVANWRYVRGFCLIAIPSMVTLLHRNLASADISGHSCRAEGHNKGTFCREQLEPVYCQLKHRNQSQNGRIVGLA